MNTNNATTGTTTTTTTSFLCNPEMAYAELSLQFRRRPRGRDDGGERNAAAAEEARMRALSRALEDLTTTREGRTLDVRSSVAIAKKLIERGDEEENEEGG